MRLNNISAVALLLLLVLLLAPSVLSADWQYTRWGMSPEEVQAASLAHGDGELTEVASPVPLRAVPPTPAAAGGEGTPQPTPALRKLRGHYTVGDMAMLSTFAFEDGRLVSVALAPRGDAQDGRALLEALKGKYGTPDEVSGISTVWRVRGENLRVEFVQAFGLAAVTYTRLNAGEVGKL